MRGATDNFPSKKELYISWLFAWSGIVGIVITGSVVVPTNECHRNNYAFKCSNGTGFEFAADANLFEVGWTIIALVAIVYAFTYSALYVTNKHRTGDSNAN